MFKPGRWRGEKNKMKALFKLQFHATQVRDIGVDELVLSTVPNESGKTELRSEKATVTDGVCKWKNPIFESVTFNRELRTGKFSKKIYHFVVSTGSARRSSVGEVSIDLADYADAVKPCTVSVPLGSSGSNNNGVLHVSILRVQGSGNPREIEDAVDMNLQMYDDGKLKPRSSNASDTESVCSRSSQVERLTKADPSRKSYSQVNDRASSGSDMTLSTSESGSCTEQDPTSFVSLMSYASVPRQTTLTPHEDNRKFEWEWSFDQTPKTETAEIEKLKTELAAMSRKFDLSELELQTLRKQIMKENKRCQELLREVSGLRAERDSIIDIGDSRIILEEVRKELIFEKETNSNLRMRNAELARELEEMLEKTSDLSRNVQCRSADGALDDVELDKEELEMQMEQMALEFEILKQENHDLLSKLEQSELKEELNLAEIEIERRAEELEEEMEDRAREFEAELEEITRGKVELEKRAIRAEEALNKMRLGNRKTAVRLQEEFGKLAKQMDSIFIEKVHEIEAKSKELEKIRDELKRSDMEKHNLRKQVSRLKDEAVKKNSVRSPDVRGSKEIATLKEKIRSLEKHLQLQESELESTRNGFFEKEKEMQKQIEELERKLEDESGKLKERNKSVEDELKNLQERYSEISVKFALAEGERQQLMITLRNITDPKT